MTTLSVTIAQVVLEGVDADLRDPARLARMTESALQRLVERRGVPTGLVGGTVPVVRVPDLRLPGTVGEGRLAAELAQSLYRTLDRPLDRSQ